MAAAQSESLTVSAQTLRRRLRERGLLTSTAAARQELTVRCTLDGCRRNVLHLQASLFVTEPAQPAQHEENAEKNGRVCGRVWDGEPANPPTKPAQNAEENCPLGGLGGLDSGGEASRNGEFSTYLAAGLSEDDARTPFDEERSHD